jgi:hypothetical protein
MLDAANAAGCGVELAILDIFLMRAAAILRPSIEAPG